MKISSKKRITTLFSLLAVCLSLPVSARNLPPVARDVSPVPRGVPNGVPNGVPKGLNVVDWKQIRAEYERHRHGAFPDGSGLQARSFEQQWLSKFDARGFTVQPDDAAWSWGLELAGVSGKAKVISDVNRITYRWSPDLDEWFLNDIRGLEHGFTLRAPRPDLRLSVRGGLTPRLAGEGVEFVESDGTVRVRYIGLRAWDADGKSLHAVLKLRRGQVVLSLGDRGARYPVTIDPIAQQAYLKASNTEGGDTFGRSVAISGDTVVVAAPSEASNATGVGGNQADNSASNSGAAYVFVRSGGAWSQQAYLKASNTGSIDLFGVSVAISGDTLVVGARFEDSNATGVGGNQTDNSASNSGAAYVFARSGSTWSQQAYLKASNTGAGDNFGYSVGISGDTVVVGALQEASSATGVGGNQADNSASGSGAAYVFARSGGVWTQQAYLKASNTGANDAFGFSVGISGDTVVVGAYGEASNATGVGGNQADNSAFGSGAAYVFVRSGVAWSQQAYLKASNTGANYGFGYSVGISGDTVVVGAYQEFSNATGVGGNQTDNSAPSSGAAYVYVRSGGVWSQQAYLKASNTGAGDNFGYSVGISGDTVVVGAYQEDSNATGVGGNQTDNSAPNSGAAYVFVRSGSAWIPQAYLKASNTGADDLFGWTVAISGDTVVAGALLEDSNATGVGGVQADDSAFNSGAAYVFFVPPTTDITISSSPAGLSFATSGTGCAPGTYTAPQTLQWTPASACSVAFTTPQSGNAGIEYRLNQWEDNSTFATRSITAPASATTYTASFDTYYQLTTAAGTGGTVSAGAFVLSGNNASITATPSAGYLFTNFTGSTTSSSNPLSLLMDAPKSITANFTPAATITSSPSGLAFTVSGSGCLPGSYTAPQTLAWTPASNCTVTFSTPQAGPTGTQYAFNHWEDSSTNPSRGIVAGSSPATYTAAFDTQYLLTTAPGTGGTVSAGGYYTSGGNASITATPSPGYAFANFTGAATSTSNPLSLLMDAPKSITANFTPTATITSSPAGLSFTAAGAGCSAGSYTTPQTLTWTPASNCTVTFATPQAGATGIQYAFNHWEDSSTNPVRGIVAGSSPATYTAAFDTQYLLTTTAGTGGTVTAGGYYNAGTNAAVTATPSGSYVFTNFTGAVTSTSNPLSLLMDAPKSVAANFTPTATIASTPSGLSFTAAGTGCSAGSYATPQVLTWTPGSNCTVTFAPVQAGAAGTRYAFNHWEDNSVNPTRAITSGSSPASYTATFDTQYLLTTTAGLGGSVSSGGYFNAGTNAAVTATPSGGFAFTNFTGATTSTSNPLSLLMDAPKSVTANFATSGTALLSGLITSKVDGILPNERVWTIQVTNTGTGAAANARVANVEVLAANPAGNLPLISLSNTSFPVALANPALSPGQSSTAPVRIIFPVTSPATRLQVRITLAADNGVSSTLPPTTVTR